MAVGGVCLLCETKRIDVVFTIAHDYFSANLCSRRDGDFCSTCMTSRVRRGDNASYSVTVPSD